MQRAIRFVSLTLTVVTIWCVPAEASIWDWFAELSGPGPFRNQLSKSKRAFVPGTSTLFCKPVLNGAGANLSDLRWFRVGDNRALCAVVDLRNLETNPNDRYQPVKLKALEFGGVYKVDSYLDIGLSAGFIHFSSENETTGATKGITRGTVTFPRVVFKPLEFGRKVVAPNSSAREGGFTFLQFYYKQTMILGELSRDDFFPKTPEPFRVPDDLVPNAGLNIDVAAAAHLIASFFR